VPQVVRFTDVRRVDLHEYEDRPLEPEEVRVRTLFSGISAGTELTAYRGSNPYLTKQWEEARRLFVPGAVSMEYPVEGWGYEEVGVVAELGPGTDERVRVGDVVYGTWGHRETAVLSAGYAANRVLPQGADPRIGVFAHIGAIALNAILDADIHVGETVAVFGQGTPGLIAGQLARLNGGRVIAVDALRTRLKLAAQLGTPVTIPALDSPSPAEQIKDLTGGVGADVCIEISGNYAALHEAIRAVAYNSRVVVSGFFQGGASPLFLGEEFHHNRVNVVCSQISGVAPAVSPRWSVDRLQRTVIELASAGELDLVGLVSNEMPATRAADAFELLDTQPEQAVQVLLDFREM
jgi:2-desacetyl-2-hydroxyethyl bacteriochlorophyllide A dehydrogenase